MENNTISYEKVKTVIENIVSAGVIPSVETIQRAFDRSQRHAIIEHLKKWKEAEGVQFDYHDNMKASEVKKIVAKKEEEIDHTLSLVRATMESTGDGIFVVSLQGKIMDYNEKFLELWRLPRDILENRDERVGLKMVMDQLVNPEQFFAEVEQMNEKKEGTGVSTDLYFKDGRIYERYSQPYQANGEIAGRVWSIRDVTQARKSEADLKLREQAIESNPNGILLIDMVSEQIIYANPAFETLTGYQENECLGKKIDFLYQKNRQQATVIKLTNTIKNGQSDIMVMKNFKKSGEMFWSEIRVAPVRQSITDIDTGGGFFTNSDDARTVVDHKISHYVVIISDITQRKAMEDQLIHQATHDSLTGLPNRMLLLDRLNQALLFAERSSQNAAVIFMDVDNFKLINDSLGHVMGDAVLTELAKRLKICIRSTDTIARIGGDEFVIIISPIENDNVILTIIENMMEKVRQPFIIDSQELGITVSIGIGMCPKDGSTAEDVLRYADSAMYQAKDNGKNNYCFFTKEMNSSASRKLELQNNLHQALDRQEFELVFQPVVNLEKNQMTGVEALLRWHCKELGSVSPVEFIPMAENIGLIREIGLWVFKTACEQQVAWKKSGLKNIQVSFNVSAKQLNDNDVFNKFKTILQQTGADPASLVIEITENILLKDPEDTVKKLNMFRSLGMKVAIDDFGTGYSSLSYLKDMPLDKLKIDRCFILDIHNNQDGENIVLAIIAIAKSLGLTIVAEGVENQHEIDFLKIHQADEIQGYFFSKPLSSGNCTQAFQSYQHDAKALAKKNQ